MTTGLFGNEDIFTEGPLADTVSKATTDTFTLVHDINGMLLNALIALHLSAVLFSVLVKRENLVGPMVTGRIRDTGSNEAHTRPFVSPLRALLAATAAAAIVWAAITS